MNGVTVTVVVIWL